MNEPARRESPRLRSAETTDSRAARIGPERVGRRRSGRRAVEPVPCALRGSAQIAHNPRGAEFKSGNATTRPETSLALSPRTPDVMCGWRAMGCVAARAFKLLSPAVTTAVTSFFAIRRGFQKVRLGSSKETRKIRFANPDRSIPIRSNRVERHSSGGRFGPLQNSHHRRK